MFQSLAGSCLTASRCSCRSILFGLCFYHSLLLGRKKFGTGIGTGSGSGLGFCRGYSFNMGDLVTCGDVLINYLEAYEQIPFDDLRYMFGEVFYGGHITDSMDRRCCTTYLEVRTAPAPACLLLVCWGAAVGTAAGARCWLPCHVN